MCFKEHKHVDDTTCKRALNQQGAQWGQWTAAGPEEEIQFVLLL